jgi:hypothetical protein
MHDSSEAACSLLQSISKSTRSRIAGQQGVAALQCSEHEGTIYPVASNFTW